MLSAELDQKCRTAISPGSTEWGVGSIQRDRVQPKAQATRSFPSYCRLLPPSLPAEHASLSLHADQGILPPQPCPSPSSGRPRPPETGVEWRSIGAPIGFFSCWWGTRACSDWVVHFVILFCGVLFLFWTPKSKSFVLPGMEFVLRGWLLLHSISFFICIISAALLICSHGNVKPFQ